MVIINKFWVSCDICHIYLKHGKIYGKLYGKPYFCASTCLLVCSKFLATRRPILSPFSVKSQLANLKYIVLKIISYCITTNRLQLESFSRIFQNVQKKYLLNTSLWLLLTLKLAKFSFHIETNKLICCQILFTWFLFDDDIFH